MQCAATPPSGAQLLWSDGDYFKSLGPRPCSRSGLTSGGLVAAQTKGTYDGPRVWMDGRRDVALDRDRRAGGLVVLINKVSKKQ